MVLLRRVIGDALRSRRQGQHRTLREVSTAANVSLGYLSEIERGQKEASSELLAAICEALGAHLSEVLREVSDTVALAERMPGVLVPVGGDDDRAARREGDEPQPAVRRGPTPRHDADQAAVVRRTPRPLAVPRRPGGRGQASRPAEGVRPMAYDGTVSVSVRQETPLKATLRATRTVRSAERDRDVVCAV